MIVAEVMTGLWLGWLARLFCLALPIAAQFIAYLLGISTVLQPDAELGPQSTALAALFGSPRRWRSWCPGSTCCRSRRWPAAIG